MKKIVFSLVLALSFVVQTSAQIATRPNFPARRAAEAITAQQLKDYLYFVASDEMEGRDTPSRGLDLTAKFLATMMARYGVKPAGDNGTYFQKMTLRRDSIDAANATMTVGEQKLVYGEDFLRFPGAQTVSLDAPLVYAGHGWMIKSKNIDALQGLDVRNKIVVIYSEGTPNPFLTALPQGVANSDLTGTRGTDWADAAENAKLKGATGVILVASPQLQKNWAQVQQFFGRGRMYVEKLNEPTLLSTPLPTILVSNKAGAVMFAGETGDPTKNTANASFAMNPDKRATISLATKPEIMTTQNVVGMIEGSSPQLKSEIIAVGAHYDHVGVNPNAPGEDKIWNGADDDGSGTVAVLAMAEALAKPPRKPKRSILFVWHAGEEKGLWGSEYFTQFPTVPLDKIVAQLNIDMIGRSKRDGDVDPRNKELSGANEVYVIGSKMMSTELGNLSEAVNNSYLKLAFNYRYDDPKDPNRFFFRSDHFNYARKGVPIIFYFDGVHEDYHRPGDEPQKIDYDKMQRITRTVFMTMWEIGESKTRPAVDKQLSAERLRRN